MAYHITEKCLACGACGDVCENGAIYLDEDSRYVIDPEQCLGCGLCAESCPNEAIESDE